MTDSFPRQQARTQQFTLGVPRSFQVSPDGSRVAFLRSRGGSDPVTCLWVLDVGSGEQRLVADPAGLGGDAELDPAERARRERSRERAAGIVSFAADAGLRTAAFALAGRVHLADLVTGRTRELPTLVPAADPRPDPSGRLVGYLHERALRVVDATSGADRVVAGPGETPRVAFGLAEFIAAEEMGRSRGYWWSPDGTALLAARVDESRVRRWHIADPAHPDRPAAEVSYPAAGTPNADVSLLLAGLDAALTPVPWDRAGFEYLVTACWERAAAGPAAASPPLIVVQSRDQREMRLLAVDPGTGATTVVRADADPHWVDIVPGVPARTADGRIVWACDAGGSRRLLVATAEELAAGTAAPVTPAALQLREVLSVDGDTVLFAASAEEPADVALWAAGPGGVTRAGPDRGVHTGRRAGGTTVISSRTLDEPGVTVRVLRDRGDGSAAEVARIPAVAERPSLPPPRPALGPAGRRGIRTAVLLPSWHEPGSARLPVLCDPYGGPHGQRVVAAQNAFLTPQWFAEQGFAVVIADGRGTPGRGPGWERAVAGDLAGPPLEDQVEALGAAARRCPDLDLGRVAIRGWSFGGYLAALAVLRRPDVFHAAVAGAPVTDWRLYDTHYTERYLGHPDDSGAAYEQSSLLADAGRLSRPLLLIHGLADDNVVVAHSLRLSAALLAAGRPHCVLPLSGVTHLASQQQVAENLLRLQVDFLRRALGLGAGVPRMSPGSHA
jgi:dipeptidyl-peptidase 4